MYQQREIQALGWIAVACVGLTSTACRADTAVHATVDLTAQRYIGQVSELDRKKFINVHSDFMDTDVTVEEMNYVVNELGVGFGRLFSSPFYFYDGDEPYLTQEQAKAISRGVKDIVSKHPLYRFRTGRRVVTDHPYIVFSMDKDPVAAAEWAANFFLYCYDDDYRPEYYEPMNEPFVHAGEFGKDQEAVRRQMTEWFKQIGKAFDEKGVPTKVVGYASAWPSMELWDFKHFRERMKMFMDEAGPYMDAFSVHLYDGTNVTGQDNRRTGSNAEAILDLIETYSFYKWDTVKPHALTEFGDIPKGYPPGYSDTRHSQEIRAINQLLFAFLEREDRIEIAVPFITLKSSWYYNDPKNKYEPYGVDLYRPDPDKIVDGRVEGFIKTPKFRFYEFWQGVKGRRAATVSDDPDIYVRAFVDGRDAYVGLCSLESSSTPVKLDVRFDPKQRPEQITLKRLYIPSDNPARYTVETLDAPPTEIVLEPHESVLYHYRFDQPIQPKRTVRSKSHYSKTHLQPIEADKPITFAFHDVQTGDTGTATLRMSIGRKHDKSKKPRVEVNGHEVPVPDDWPGYDQANRHDFFGMIPIACPIEYIRPETTVTITFPDSGGHLSSLVLVTEVESQKEIE